MDEEKPWKSELEVTANYGDREEVWRGELGYEEGQVCGEDWDESPLAGGVKVPDNYIILWVFPLQPHLNHISPLLTKHLSTRTIPHTTLFQLIRFAI